MVFDRELVLDTKKCNFDAWCDPFSQICDAIWEYGLSTITGNGYRSCEIGNSTTFHDN